MVKKIGKIENKNELYKLSHINTTIKNKIDLNPKKTRKIRHFKTIKKTKQKKINKNNDL